MTETKDLYVTVDLGKEKLDVKVTRKQADEMKQHYGMKSDQEVLIETENQILRSVGRLDE